jgi:3-hydroxyacyl-CoA dehydrogenase
MGGAIAAVAAGKGIPVRMREIAREPLEKGMAHAHGILQGRRRRRRPESWLLPRFVALTPTLGFEGFASADLILEAVVEDLEIKRRVLSEIESRVRDDCLLATNTSSLSVDEIARALRRPERFIGLHFFNPVERMPLVEVVRGAQSLPAGVAAAVAFTRRLGKTPVVVRDAPGFVVNRLLMPYLAEALQVLLRGGDVEAIDRAMVRFGMPMGPLALFDQIGMDVAAKVAKVLAGAFGGRLPPFGALETLVEAGRLGAKSGKGFYVHEGRKRRPDPEAAAMVRSSAGSSTRGGERDAPSGDRLIQRLLYPVINEAARLLDEGVAESAAMVDLAMVFGTGFPPFLGGPLRWADKTGLGEVASALREMAGRGEGNHLAPSEALEKLAAGRGRFHEA